MRKEHETHANSLMQNHLSMAISKLDALENKITLTVDTLENKIASKVNALENKIMLRVDALENKIMSKVESLETKTVSKAVALENKITSKVELFENKNASEVVALENKITSTVDALKNELISKVDAQKDEIMLHEKNLEIIKAFLAVKTQHFVPFLHFHETTQWIPHPCHDAETCFDTSITHKAEEIDNASCNRTEVLEEFRDLQNDQDLLESFHFHFGSVFAFYKKMQKKYIDS
ncbi:uncharacterized protein LOC136084004 isoform X2 [Hydra vulgaris]|uniref:Uncharacterized protein LOC136084004 isoform X2 n=1 Tax=Hydra vulgaris TaxID=6087 RepID=A0ABM4CEG6_HYDVU